MKKFLSNFKQGAVKHGPGISIVAGVIGLVASNVFTFFGTIKSVRKIDEIEKELGRKTTNKEKVKYCWKHYIPSITTITTSVGAVIGGDKVKTKRFKQDLAANAIALATEKANFESEREGFQNYKDAVEDKLSKKQKEEVEQEYRNKQYENMKPTMYNQSALKEDQFLCFDSWFNVWFAASKNELEAAANKINKMTSVMQTATPDDFYEALENIQDENGTDGYRNGEAIVRPGICRSLGWAAGQELTIYTDDTGIRPNDNKPAIFVDYAPSPTRDYMEL